MKALNAHFDGRHIVLDEPATLKPNAKVKVIPLETAGDTDELMRNFAKLSEPAFQMIWDNPLDADYNKL